MIPSLSMIRCSHGASPILPAHRDPISTRSESRLLLGHKQHVLAGPQYLMPPWLRPSSLPPRPEAWRV